VKQLLEDIRKSAIIRAPIAGISRVAGVARIPRVPDVSKIAEMLVYDHVLVQFANVRAGQFVHVCSGHLTDSPSGNLVNMPDRYPTAFPRAL
jgi:hypothetical protein